MADLLTITTSFVGSICVVGGTIFAVMHTCKSNFKIAERKNQNESNLAKLRTSQEKLELILDGILKIKALYTFTDSFINEVKYDNSKNSSLGNFMVDYHTNYQNNKLEICKVLAVSQVYFTKNEHLHDLIEQTISKMNMYWGSSMNVLQCIQSGSTTSIEDNKTIGRHRGEVIKYADEISNLVNNISKEVGKISIEINITAKERTNNSSDT